jgi:hypothetical protein
MVVAVEQNVRRACLERHVVAEEAASHRRLPQEESSAAATKGVARCAIDVNSKRRLSR